MRSPPPAGDSCNSLQPGYPVRADLSTNGTYRDLTIAYALDITETTAKNHVQHILKKLGAQDRTRAATAAIERGIIHL